MPYKSTEAKRASWRKYYANSEKAQQDRRDRKAKYIARNKLYVDAIRSGPCTDCGNTFPVVCMQFDHLPEFDKYQDVGNLVLTGRSIEVIQAEIDKCELVCANCHCIRTAERRKT